MIGKFPILPELESRDFYIDGTPTLSSLIEQVLASNKDTRKYLDCVVLGADGKPLEDLKK